MGNSVSHKRLACAGRTRPAASAPRPMPGALGRPKRRHERPQGPQSATPAKRSHESTHVKFENVHGEDWASAASTSFKSVGSASFRSAVSPSLRSSSFASAAHTSFESASFASVQSSLAERGSSGSSRLGAGARGSVRSVSSGVPLLSCWSGCFCGW